MRVLHIQLLRLGQVLGALVLAALLAWLGMAYNSNSGFNTAPEGVRLLRTGLLKTEPGVQPTAAQMLARQDWVPLAQSGPTGWTVKTVWVRLELENTTPFLRDVFLEVAPPRLTHIQLHQRMTGGAWRTDVSGVSVAAQNRSLNVPDIVFTVPLQPQEKRVVLVQAQSNTTALNMAFTLHEPAAFAAKAVHGSLLDLMLIGAALALGIICLFIGVALRQPLQILLGLRSLLLGSWLLLQLGFLSLLLPGALVAAVALQTVWAGWLLLALTMGFVWLFLNGASPVGLPKWAHAGFSVLAVLLGLAALAVAAGLQHTTQLAPQIGQINIAMTVFTLLLSTWMVWRGQLAAAMVVVTSCCALLVNFRVHLSILGISNSDPLRQVISPIPALITSAVFFVGITVQLLRERQAQQAIRQHAQRQAMAQLEAKVSERTLALQAARDEARQANAAKSLFMAKVSHELRTPMHTVLGYVSLVLRDQPTDVVSRRLKVAHRAGQQLVSQINDLLDYVRIDHAQMRLAHAAFALPAMLQSVSEQAGLLGVERGNSFTSTLSVQGTDGVAGARETACALWLMGDQAHIEQVLLVLLSNAMRYTQHGSVALHTTVLAPLASENEPCGTQHVQFAVTDTGRGIAPEALARIFVLFERGAATDRDGLGLGLPIAQHLLSLMDSRLEVRSQPGQGSTFSFTLALTQADEAQALQLQEPTAHVMAGYAGTTLRILLLEDNPTSRQYLEELLGDMGFDVCAVATVGQAQDAVRSTSAFDLYIVDQHLGEGASGWDFIKYLRASAVTPAARSTCPVLMLSATQASPPADWGMRHGIDLHVLKPVSEPALVQALTVLVKPQWIERAANTEAATETQPIDALPSTQTAHWAELQQAAKSGCVTTLNHWCNQHPTLLTSHPALAPMVAQLSFLQLEQYAQSRQSG